MHTDPSGESGLGSPKKKRPTADPALMRPSSDHLSFQISSCLRHPLSMWSRHGCAEGRAQRQLSSRSVHPWGHRGAAPHAALIRGCREPWGSQAGALHIMITIQPQFRPLPDCHARHYGSRPPPRPPARRAAALPIVTIAALRYFRISQIGHDSFVAVPHSSPVCIRSAGRAGLYHGRL